MSLCSNLKKIYVELIKILINYPIQLTIIHEYEQPMSSFKLLIQLKIEPCGNLVQTFILISPHKDQIFHHKLIQQFTMMLQLWIIWFQ